VSATSHRAPSCANPFGRALERDERARRVTACEPRTPFQPIGVQRQRQEPASLGVAACGSDDGIGLGPRSFFRNERTAHREPARPGGSVLGHKLDERP
jgi:hypothetical protein